MAGSIQYDFDPFVDEAGEHRWRLVHANGNIVGDSSEGYTDDTDRDTEIENIVKAIREGRVTFGKRPI